MLAVTLSSRTAAAVLDFRAASMDWSLGRSGHDGSVGEEPRKGTRKRKGNSVQHDETKGTERHVYTSSDGSWVILPPIYNTLH
jgi:hypothetical protein